MFLLRYQTLLARFNFLSLHSLFPSRLHNSLFELNNIFHVINGLPTFLFFGLVFKKD